MPVSREELETAVRKAAMMLTGHSRGDFLQILVGRLDAELQKKENK